MHRKTRQRDAIWATIKTSSRPLSALEIQSNTQQRLPGIGIATVYRAIKVLRETGRLAEVAVPGHGCRYESADLSHHHHFYCEDCDKVFDINGCPNGITKLAPQGFKVRDHVLTLIGVCPECVA